MRAPSNQIPPMGARRLILSAAAACFLAALGVAAAAQDAPRAEDRATLDACLKENSDTPEKCIGTVYGPCVETPEGSSTAGMGECSRRETAVWDERMNASLKQLLTGSLGQTEADPSNRPPENKRDKKVPGVEIINDMQQIWVTFRAKKCDTESMQAEGGSLSRVIYGSCFYDETARHALWLAELVDDTSPH